MSSIFPGFALAMAARVTREMAAVFAETISPKRKALGLRPALPRRTKRHPRERDQEFESHFLPAVSPCLTQTRPMRSRTGGFTRVCAAWLAAPA